MNEQLASGHTILDHTVNGNRVAVAIEYLGRVYRFNANNKLVAVGELLNDFRQHDLVVLYRTRTSGDKIDTANRKTPRMGLYAYSN